LCCRVLVSNSVFLVHNQTSHRFDDSAHLDEYDESKGLKTVFPYWAARGEDRFGRASAVHRGFAGNGDGSNVLVVTFINVLCLHEVLLQ